MAAVGGRRRQTPSLLSMRPSRLGLRKEQEVNYTARQEQYGRWIPTNEEGASQSLVVTGPTGIRIGVRLNYVGGGVLCIFFF